MVAITDCLRRIGDKKTSIYDYFKSYCLEVIDNRDKGGALWVVGTPESIGSFVNEACIKFCCGGKYTDNGRATGHRMAWFTKCRR